MQDPVDDEQAELAARIVRVVARRDRRRDHDVAEHAQTAFVLAVQGKTEHVGRARLVEVADVQVLHLGFVDEAERELHLAETLGE